MRNAYAAAGSWQARAGCSGVGLCECTNCYCVLLILILLYSLVSQLPGIKFDTLNEYLVYKSLVSAVW